MKSYVYCTTRFEGFHAYNGAPVGVSFLESRHRHIFHVRLEIEVLHDNREIEFILLKRALDSFIQKEIQPRPNVGSCEMVAANIITEFSEKYPDREMTCEVSEDGENGAVVHS